MSRLRIHVLILLALLSTALFTSAQTATPPADTPVGHWVAEHTSKGGIASWWDFRADGTLTMHIGAAVTSTITRAGDSFTEPGPTTTSPPVKVTWQVEGGTLHLKTGDNPEQTFARVGPAPSATDPLIGKWRPLPPATPSTDPNAASQQKLMLNSVFVFSADNKQSVRIPFTSLEGTWDATAHTFQIEKRPGAFSFQRTGSKLTLGQPPDGHQTDTYLPDPIV
jgi:hypothetical protein